MAGFRAGFVSHARQVRRLHKQFAVAAVRASALVVQNQAKRNVRGGFTTGAFVTGNLMNNISHQVLSATGTAPSARVGTVVAYGAFWELGHFNPFMRRFARKQWLVPAFATTGAAQQAAVVIAIKRIAKKSALAKLLGRSVLAGVRVQ